MCDVTQEQSCIPLGCCGEQRLPFSRPSDVIFFSCFWHIECWCGGVQIAQAGSQGDKKARRVLSLRAHHLKENLLKAKTDLKAQKAACRHQAYKIGQLA